jgi:carboxymethylenebutenolidase
VREFYARYLIAQVPDDIGMDIIITRTVGDDRVIGELLVHFTHSVQMDWFAPGIAPTGRAVAARHAAVIGFRDGLIRSEHIYWDQATVLVQLGVLDPGDLPMLGAEQPARFTAPTPSFAPPSSSA